MKRCPSCSLANTSDAAFCIRCGFPLVGVTADATSPGGEHESEGLPRPGYLGQGTLVDGKYAIQRVLGEGGMGVVYLARDIHTETPVVVKSIRAEFADNPEFRARTLAEGRALARIDHPNVVRLNAVVVESVALYLIMQFIDGEPLDRMIERHVAERRAIPLGEALSIFRMILLGVGAAHAEGLIHRDLKPANVLIRKKDGVAKVTDFGIAKGEEDAKAGRGVTRGIIGSLSYMAPEQVRGQRDLDKRVDVYALGILLYELLMGRVPFEAASDYELMRMHAEMPVPSITERRPDIPRAIDDMVQRACAKDRAARFAGTHDFLSALDAADPASAWAPHPSRPPAVKTEVPGRATEIASAPMPYAVVPPPPPEVRLESVRVPKPSPLPFEPVRANTTTGELPSALPRASVSGASVERRGHVDRARSRSGGRRGRNPAATRQPRRGGRSATGGRGRGRGRERADARGGSPSRGCLAARSTRALSPLAALVGKWRSSSKRDFAAVLAGDKLEFRVLVPSQHPRQGYEEGDARFALSLAPTSAKNEFAVEDHLRPTPPPGVDYDDGSRSTCVATFDSVKGRNCSRSSTEPAGLPSTWCRSGRRKTNFRSRASAWWGASSSPRPRPIPSKAS